MSTKITISANIDGADQSFEFEVPTAVTMADWKQMTALFKMAMQQLGAKK